MTVAVPSTSFDPSLAWQRLLRGVVGAVVGCAAILAILLVLVANPLWWRGYLAATLASILAAGLSLIPLRMGLHRGFSGVMNGFLAASGVRFFVALGAAALAVGVGDYPKIPTFCLVLPYYLATLASEALVMARLQTNSTTPDRLRAE